MDKNIKKMKITWSCCGAAGGSAEITPPQIDRICQKCGYKMELIDGRGFINSGTHTFLAQCPECGEKEKLDDTKLWENLWKKC